MEFTAAKLNAMSLFKLKETAKLVGVYGYSKYNASKRSELESKILELNPKKDICIYTTDHGVDALCEDVHALSINQEEKRVITDEEIDKIVMSIPENKSIPPVIAAAYISLIRNRVREQLQNQVIYPSIIHELTEEIVKQYNNSQVSPGEVVGIITAQSIGERQTQMTLDTFHSAGAALKTVITGVPRFSELLSATKNPKSVVTYIHTIEKYGSVSDIRKLGCTIPHITLGDVLVSINESGCEKCEWYVGYEMLYGTEHNAYDVHITLEFDINKLFVSNIELDTISTKIEQEYTDLRCVYSPTFLGRIDVYIDVQNIEQDKVYEYILTTVIPNLKTLSINGIQGIKEVFYENKNGGWVMETFGSNLVKLFNTEWIDYTQTVSNDMWEIVNVLGIEAGRDFLVNEFMNIISSDGTFVNKCHIELLVDTMTFGGSIMSVSRYGQRTSKCGPLARASFEESFSNLIKAGVTGETENLTSVSSAIIVGKLASCGTGAFDVLVDFEKLSNGDEMSFNDNEIYEL